MEVSVIIPTYNRADQLPDVLGAMKNQTFRAFEIIVVNDGSTDNTLSTIERYCCDLDVPLKVIESKNLGRAGARNLGTRHAAGTLLVFYDDDTRPNPDSLLRHVECHRKTDKILVSGPYLYDYTRFRNNFNYFRATLESQWTNPAKDLVESMNLRINGGNCSIKAKHFTELSGFDERLKDKEDFKLAYDFARKLGGKVYTRYSTWVFHDDFRPLHAYISRERGSRLEEQKLRDIDPKIALEFPERFNIMAPTTFKYIVSRPLRFPFFIRLFEWILEYVPIGHNLKFKVYDWLVTMNVRYIK